VTVLTVDFETYYDSEYSLSKMTTEEYVRNPHFEAIGVSVKVNQDPARWFSGPKHKIKAFLDQFPWEQATAVAHNAPFDMSILNWHFDIRPKRIACTLSMGRALHGATVGGSLKALAEHYGLGEKGDEVIRALGKRRHDFMGPELDAYGRYCSQDVELCYGLFEAMVPQFPVSELQLIDLTTRMFTEPVLELDRNLLTDHLKAVKLGKENLLARIGGDNALGGVMSNDKLATNLKFLGVDPPMKKSPTTGKPTYAFAKSDEAFKALLEHPNEKVQALVAARLGVKSTLEETRTERFLQIAKRGTLPIPLKYYAAHTGRWGGDDKINLQNLPRSSPLKKAIRAPEGFVFVDSDSSQIEARTLAWWAGQDDLVMAFENGDDVYCIMGTTIYRFPVTKKNERERFVGKTTILGCGYGMGAAKFQQQLKTFGVELDLAECERIIHVYRSTYTAIPALWNEGKQAIMAMIGDRTVPFGREGVVSVEGQNGIRLPNGLYLRYPNLRAELNPETANLEYVYDTRKGRATIPTRIYGGKLVENVCQALARIIIGEQMLRVRRKYRVVMTVHDAMGVLVPEHEAETGQEFVELCMRIRPSWAPDLPLNCEARNGPTYGK
jgi:hypothetical protein